MHDFYPGFKLEEEYFSKAIIKNVNESQSKKKSKSDLQEEPMTWPREKSGRETAYERFLEEVIDPESGEFYPEIKDKIPVPKTGATYYITDIYRIRRADGSEFLYSKGRVDAFNTFGDPVNHFISMPEIWTKTNFSYRTEWNERTKQPERILQGPSPNTETVYTLPFTKENLKQLYDRRQNDLINFIVIKEGTREARQVEDVNSQKRFELFQKDFDYLLRAEYMPAQIKAELRQEAIDRGWIQAGTNSAGIQPSSNSSGDAKTNTYQ